jgi:hypothetical protein
MARFEAYQKQSALVSISYDWGEKKSKDYTIFGTSKKVFLFHGE